MHPSSSVNEVGSNFPPFVGFPPVMMDVAQHGGQAGCKNGTLNSSYMNYSLNTNSIPDTQSVSYNRDGAHGNTQQNSTSFMQMVSPHRMEGNMFTHVPAPPTAMGRRTMDSDALAASTVRRLDNSLSFSASTSYLPVAAAAPSWSYHPPSSMAAAAEAASAAPRLYPGMPPNGLLVRMMDAAGNMVWCLQPDHNGLAPPPPPPPPCPPVSLTSPLQTSMVESPGSSQPAQASTANAKAPPPFKVSPLAWSLQVPPGAAPADSSTASHGGRVPSPDVPAVPRDASSPPSESEADEYEYEPYNSNTLANRRVGSLDRVRCIVHGKERSAQNMVMMRHKTTGDVFWRCKHSSQCKARPVDSDETPMSSKESTLRSTAAEMLLSPNCDQSPMMMSMSGMPVHLGTSWSRQPPPPPPPPQYTLVSPNNMSLGMESSVHAMSPPMQTFSTDFLQSTGHLVTLPSAFTPGGPPGPSATYYPFFMADGAPQLGLPPAPLPPPPPPQAEMQSGTVNVNGVTYRLVHM